MSQLRRQVLNAFKKLHRTREYVFNGDKRALLEGRIKINESFKNNKHVTNEEEIKKMVNLAKDVDHELRTNVIQAMKRDDDVYELRITPETTTLENVPFNPDAVIERPRRRAGAKNTSADGAGCCGGAAMAALESEVQRRGKK